MKRLKKFEELNESVDIFQELNESLSDKVIDMQIDSYEMDEYTDFQLVVKTQSGKKYYIKAKIDSPNSDLD